MMILDYGTQISFEPIKLSIGTIIKPTLKQIAKISFKKFELYESLLKITPEHIYTKLLKDNGGQEMWDSIDEHTKDNMTIFDVIQNNEYVRALYIEMLNFFFQEALIYREGYLLVIKENISNLDMENIQINDIYGAISRETLPKIFSIIEQICGIYNKEEDIDNMKFKNEFQKQYILKMLKNQKKNTTEKNTNINLSVPNIISALTCIHPSINYTNIWEMTVFQLYDSFNRLQQNKMYDIDSTRVSVWGDEKKTFDFGLWYKNNYDNNEK